jgi:hypothetical protein
MCGVHVCGSTHVTRLKVLENSRQPLALGVRSRANRQQQPCQRLSHPEERKPTVATRAWRKHTERRARGIRGLAHVRNPAPPFSCSTRQPFEALPAAPSRLARAPALALLPSVRADRFYSRTLFVLDLTPHQTTMCYISLPAVPAIRMPPEHSSSARGGNMREAAHDPDP